MGVSIKARIARYALAYVANADDRHAALYLAVTELGSYTPESALKIIRAGEPLSDPVLEVLEPLREGAPRQTRSGHRHPRDLLGYGIERVDLYGSKGHTHAYEDDAEHRR